MNFYTKGKLDYYKSISLTDFHALPMMLNFMNIHEMSRRHVNNMAASRFSNDLPSEFIQTNLHNKKTKEGTKYACNILKDFCAARGEVGGQIESLNGEELGELLCDFYANVRSKDGEIYKKSSMLAIRSGLNRHLKTPPHSKQFDIITDPAFVSANNVFKAMLKKIQSEGKGSIVHKDPIPKEDLQRLYDHPTVFNPNIPQGLVNKTFFEILLYFCRRGRENLRDLKPENFGISTDPDGRKYVHKVLSEQTKNHQGTSNDSEGSGARMYATGTAMCPVASFEKYLNKLHPACPALFQHPKTSFTDQDLSWFENRPMGKNHLAEMMPQISKHGGLSQRFTNHCVRATMITTLSHVGFEARHIMTISGHKNESSIRSYCSDTTAEQKRQMSDAITGRCVSESQVVPVGLEQNAQNTITNLGSVRRMPSDVSLPEMNWDMDLPDDIFENSVAQIESHMHSKTLNATNINSAPVFNVNNSVVNVYNIYK